MLKKLKSKFMDFKINFKVNQMLNEVKNPVLRFKNSNGENFISNTR